MINLAVLMWMGVITALTSPPEVPSKTAAFVLVVVTFAVFFEAGHVQAGSGTTMTRKCVHWLAFAAFLAHVCGRLYFFDRA